MNLLFFGISDVLIILFVAVMGIIGFKKGFLEKFISIASIVSGFICACIFCIPFGRFVDKHFVNEGSIGKSVYEMVFEKITASGSDDPSSAIESLGLPKFMNSIIEAKANGDSVSSLSDAIRDKLTLLISIAIGFIILFIGITIGIRLFKGLAKALKQFDFFVTVDNVFGCIFGCCIALLIIFVLYLILPVLFQIPQLGGFKQFMYVDMQLTTSKWRLSKFLYDYNLIGKLLEALF